MATDRRTVPDVADLTGTDGDVDALFRVLSNGRRRYVLACLRQFATPMALSDVADEVATYERDATTAEIPADAVRSVHTRLYHVHVPMLADAGLVDYDEKRDAVAPTEAGSELASRLAPPVEE